MTDTGTCICGHPENMHFGGTKPPHRCMKVITRHHSGNVVCTCREFRLDLAGTPTEDRENG